MDPVHNHMYTKPPLPTSDSAFPIFAIAVLSIVATAFILVSYYILVIKCCINWHQLNAFTRRFSTSQARPSEDSLITYSPTSIHHRGLDESLIREIPTFQFKREGEERRIYKCVVCLNEFQEQDMLRLLPSCSHAFHLDCIDIWLQSNANCPLCRSSITGRTRYPIDQTIAPSSSPEAPQAFSGSLMGSDEDYVVIELMGGEDGQQERQDLRQVQYSSAPSPRKQKPRKLHVSSKGDECIDVREKDDQFLIQPIRRSFSMDSATDQQIYLCVQAVLREKGLLSEISTDEECSSRARRSFFPFGHGRGSRNAVFPIEC